MGSRCTGARRTLVAWLLAPWALVASAPSLVAQQARSSQEAEPRQDEEPSRDGYVELFDPDRDDPNEPPTVPIPELPLETGADETEPEERQLFPWDPEPKVVPDRVLAPDDPRDPRSVDLFYYGCADELHRRDVTLFANGTLRLRQGAPDAPEMQLEEIGPVELRGHLNRLLRIRASHDFPDQMHLDGSLGGRWIDTCRFRLDLPGFEPVQLEVGAFDLLPLELRQLVQYADELSGLTRPLVRPDALPPDYAPEIGDLLRTYEGKVYRVRGRTSDGGALELESLDGAWRIFVPEDEFPEHFAALEVDLSAARRR